MNPRSFFSRYRLALVLLLLCMPFALAAQDQKRNGSGTMKLDGKTIALVDAFVVTGEMIDYDENGTRFDHYELVLTAAGFDHAAIARSKEPVSDFREWLYVEEPASLTIHLNHKLETGLMKASGTGEYHSNTLTCYCDGAVPGLKLENGRLRGKISAPALRSRHEGPDDPSAGRSLSFEVEIDVPVVSVQN